MYAEVRSNFDLAAFAADLRAQESGYRSVEARQRVMAVANSGKLSRREAKRLARKANKH